MKAKITLDYESSYRAVETAVRTQAQVVLNFPAFPEHTLNGFLISGDQSALLMELTGKPTLNISDLLNTSCQVRIYSDQRYFFSAEIKGTPQWGDTRSIALSRPMALTVLDRRRFIRAQLAPSTRVSVEWTASDGFHRHSATLLNVSHDGMALRMDDDGAAAIRAEEQLVAVFEMPGQSKPFHLHATMANKTPATGGHSIVGLQFTRSPDQAAQLEALKQVLVHHGEVTDELEVMA